MDERPPADDAETPVNTPAAEMARKAARGRLGAVQTFGTVGTIGFAFVFSIGIGVALGLGIDKLTGWSPFGLIVFFILGFAAGVVNVYRLSSRSSK